MVYRIKRWNELFETAETRKLKKLHWVPTPNKHDGKGFRRIAAIGNRCEIFAAFMLMLQIASKCPERGTLCDEDGPITAEDMSMKTGYPTEIFSKALTILSGPKIGWIEIIQEVPGNPKDPTATADEQPAQSGNSGSNAGQFAGIPAESPAIPGDAPAEGKGREGKERREVKIPQPQGVLDTEAFRKVWGEWVPFRRKMKGCKDWETMFSKQLEQLESYGVEGAIKSLNASMAGGWTGIFEPKGQLGANKTSGIGQGVAGQGALEILSIPQARDALKALLEKKRNLEGGLFSADYEETGKLDKDGLTEKKLVRRERPGVREKIAEVENQIAAIKKRLPEGDK